MAGEVYYSALHWAKKAEKAAVQAVESKEYVAAAVEDEGLQIVAADLSSENSNIKAVAENIGDISSVLDAINGESI